jgi:hypothetical protein
VANNFAPTGFAPVNTSLGAAINWKLSTRRISAANATPIFKGDAVTPVLPASGYITQATNTSTLTAPLAGIFWGCQYLSTSQKRIVWSSYWPGADATGDVTAYVYDDPTARFMVQTSGAGFQITGTPATFTDSPVGQYCNLNVGVGNTLSGQSGMFVDTLATTATFPFIITDMVLDPPGSNGTDATSQFNYVVVGFNNQWLRSNSAVTGIA